MIAVAVGWHDALQCGGIDVECFQARDRQVFCIVCAVLCIQQEVPVGRFQHVLADPATTGVGDVVEHLGHWNHRGVL